VQSRRRSEDATRAALENPGTVTLAHTLLKESSPLRPVPPCRSGERAVGNREELREN